MMLKVSKQYSSQLFWIPLFAVLITALFPAYAICETNNNFQRPKKISLSLFDKVDWTPIEFALLSPFQVFGTSTDVRGLRISAFTGYNPNIYGLDLTVGASMADNISGIQCSLLLNYIKNNFSGLQISSWNSSRHVTGIQMGIFGNVVNDSTDDKTQINGIQISFGRNEAKNIYGLQISGGNRSEMMVGSQIGLFNLADTITGMQIGLFNVSTNLTGVQIGILNYSKNARLPFLPIINVKF